MSNTNPIPCIKELISVVNKKKKEIDDISKEIYKMVLDLEQYKGKKITVTYETGKVRGITIEKTVAGTLESVSKVGESFALRVETSSNLSTTFHIKVLSIRNMKIDED